MTDRLFFALWPDPALRQRLEQRLPPLAAAVHGRPQRPDQWHVTLEFLGGVPVERQAAVRAAGDAVAGDPVRVEFDRLEHWRRPQVYCVCASVTPAPLARLVTELRAALFTQGFVPETRDFRPHVTLARKVRIATPGPLPEPIRWSSESFALVRSVADAAGSRYEPLRWWNLRSRGD